MNQIDLKSDKHRISLIYGVNNISDLHFLRILVSLIIATQILL